MCNLKGKDQYIEKQNQTVNEKLDRLNAFLADDDVSHEGKTHQLLVIDDDLTDVELIRKMLDNAKIKFEMTVINNGEDAISFLERESQWENMPLPDLIIVDVNHPKITGSDILHYLGANTYLAWIPRLLVTSDEETFKQLFNNERESETVIHKPIKKPELLSALSALNPLMYTGLAG